VAGHFHNDARGAAICLAGNVCGGLGLILKLPADGGLVIAGRSISDHDAPQNKRTEPGKPSCGGIFSTSSGSGWLKFWNEVKTLRRQKAYKAQN